MGDRSPFRAGYLGVELFYNGAWHAIPASDISADGVTITRGRSPEGGRVDPSSATVVLRNGDGTYSPRNPRSALYGAIGRNTPIRIWTEHTAGAKSHRFRGEVVEWPQRWGRTGASSATAPIVAAGVLRRLSQGAAPLRSPLRRAISTIGSNLVAYWPCEEGQDATTLAPLVGTRPATITGAPTFAGHDGFLASEPLPLLGDARLYFRAPSHTSTGAGQVRWLTRLSPAVPDATILCRIRSTGTLGRVDLRYAAGLGGRLTIEGFNDAGTSVGSALWGFNGLDNKQLRMSVEMTQSGPNIAVAVEIYEPGAPASWSNSGSFAGVTLGSISTVDFNPTRVSLPDVPVGHVTVETAVTSMFSVSVSALVGHLGESATARISRLCSEADVPLTAIGASSSALDGGRTAGGSEQLGAQGLATLVDLLDEARETGGGILYEPRGGDGLALRTFESLCSQTPVTIAYQDNLLRPLEPVDDDAATRNRVTVTRVGGAARTAEVATGPLSTQPPPTGVGVYDEDVALSLGTDAQAEQHAAWRVHVGTHDEARWPQIGVDLADAPWLPTTVGGVSAARDALLAVDLGDRLDVTGLPSWLPPDDVSVLVQGATETIQPLSHTIVWSCSPARPYRVAYFDVGDRYSGAGTVLAGSMTTTSTSVTVTVPPGVQWSAADGAFDVLIGGEQIRVGNVTGSGSTQTLSNLTRSRNGVVKTHSAGEAVALADPCYVGL